LKAKDVIIIIDCGSQYTQLIARRIRELRVYSEILPWDASVEEIRSNLSHLYLKNRITGIDPGVYTACQNFYVRKALSFEKFCHTGRCSIVMSGAIKYDFLILV